MASIEEVDVACPPSQAHGCTKLIPVACIVIAAWLAGPGCDVSGLTGARREARLSAMEPGAGASNGELDCWLTIEFRRYPEDVDLRDVRVHFYSDALPEPAHFDWQYIAQNDLLGDEIGSDSTPRSAEATRPTEAPPLGQTIRVRFPLSTRPDLAATPDPLTLQAELYWGGRHQGILSKRIEPVSPQQTARVF